MFVSFEGIDGAGKSTLALMARKELESLGKSVFLTKEPTEKIEWNDALKKGRDTESGIKLFFRFTEDRFLHQNEIADHLKNGEIVLCDRFLMSSLAYQGALIEPLFGSREKTIEWMLSISEIIQTKPDLTIYIDVDPELSMKRLKSRSELTGFEETSYLRKVREFYRDTKIDGKVTIDGSGTIDAVFESIMKAINEKLRQ